MVAHTGEKDGAGAIRALNQPQSIEVRETQQGYPRTVKMNKRWARVSAIQDLWKIDDEWWRDKPVSRFYFQCTLPDGQVVNIFKDLVAGQWYFQAG